MTEINYSSLLREIVVDYFEHRISRVEYLAQRRGVLDRVDHEFNGEDETTYWPQPDITEEDITQRNPAGSSSALYSETELDADDTLNENFIEPDITDRRRDH